MLILNVSVTQCRCPDEAYIHAVVIAMISIGLYMCIILPQKTIDWLSEVLKYRVW